MASGGGSNAQKLIEYFHERDSGEIRLVLSDNENAGVLNIASDSGIPCIVADEHQWESSEWLMVVLAEYSVNFIVLAGYLKRVPEQLTRQFANRILNIHPALLPNYGGRGMYGMNVHKAVMENKDSESGITIHHVNEDYDEGDIIFQSKCEVLPDDTAKTLQERVLQLEHEHYPRVVEETLLSHFS